MSRHAGLPVGLRIRVRQAATQLVARDDGGAQAAEIRVAAGMIAVVVCDQDGGKAQSVVPEIVQYRFCVTGIHYCSVAPVANQPDVVILESKYGNDLHGNMFELSSHDVNG